MRIDRHTLLWVAGILGVTAGFLGVVTRSQWNRIAELEASLAQERSKALAVRTDTQIVPRLEQELAGLTEQTKDFEQRLPAGQELGEFLETLARSAQEHGLRADAIEPGASAQEHGVVGLPIVLRVSGAFPNLFALLQDLEGMPRLTRVEQFRTEAVEDRPGVVSAEMHLRIFYRAS
jgi:Tfp pilus assembly protein PilO